jgi:alpha-beta hydrolase superfamily lysophospholipase
MTTIMHSEIVNLQQGTITGKLRYRQPTDQLIIVCHGYRSSSDHPAIVTITEGLNKRGYATFIFNFSDESGLNLEHQVKDIAHVASYFKDYPKIILMAASFGALSSAIAAAELQRVSGLVTINGFFGSGKLGRKIRSTYLTFRLLTMISPGHKRTWIFYKRGFQPYKIAVPALVLHAEGDRVVSMAQSKDFYDKLTSSKQFTILKEADHHLSSDEAKNEVLTLIDQWLRKK